MKIQSSNFRPMGKLPTPPKPDVPVPQDKLEPPRWQKVGKTMLKGAAGAAVGALPGAAAGYAISSWGGVPGAVIGGLTGVVIGFVSGKQVHHVAQKLAAKNPEELNFFHKAALKIGPAAPYVWAAVAGAECALAGATFAPAVSTLVFAKKGMIAGALLMGTKQ